MPTAIIAGIPMRVASRVHAVLSQLQIDDWQIKMLAGGDRNIAVITARQVDSLLQQAVEAGGAHILGVTDQRIPPVSAAQFKTFFRFRWLSASIIHTISQDPGPFITQLRVALAEESAWRDQVMPKSKDSALILPEHVFRCSGEASGIWRLAEKYNEGADFYSVVASHLEDFTGQYRRRDRAISGHYPAPWYWVDDAKRVWRDDGPFHGDAPFPRDWKYSYRLPDKFHFDVGHEQRVSFTLNDCKGKAHVAKANGHLNIDAHGWRR